MAPLPACLSQGVEKAEGGFKDDDLEALISADEAAENAKSGAGEAGAPGKSRRSLLDRFLDCAIGEVDPNNREVRLLRGHMIVAMLAQYGAFNITFGNYEDKKEDATALLAQIEVAEEELRRASNIFAGGIPPETATPTVDKLRRAVAVLNVAIIAERPTVKRLRGVALNIVAAISGGPGAVKDLVRDALRGIKKVVKLDLWGGAYRQDTHTFLAQFRASAGQNQATVEEKHWTLWNREIKRACKVLEVIAGVKEHCVPSKST